MKLNLKYLIYVHLFLMVFCTLSFAKTTGIIKINDLINNDKEFDGKEVTIEGEAIGHVMKRGQFAWVNINDKTNSIGIWLNYELEKKIKYLGKYAVIGDWLLIDGIFHSRCPAHGGDTDFHANNLVIINRGSLKNLTYTQKKVNILLLLIGLLVCLYLIKILKKPR